MFPGFERIVEDRIRRAQREGAFDGLEGAGKPLCLENDANIPEDLRLAYKVMKNADILPPEIELKKEIRQTEDLLAAMPDTAEKYGVVKRLNFLIMRLNALRSGPVEFDVPQQYSDKLVTRMEQSRRKRGDR